MAFNKFMHPRNLYKDAPPNFERLAEKYEQFRRHCDGFDQSMGGSDKNGVSGGKVRVDFRKPDAVRWLAWALLKDDFGLDVELPAACLVPRIPSRLNYILWIEDLLACCAPAATKMARSPTALNARRQTSDEHDAVWGIDIGTGASCIYPLLGARQCGWRFVATERDPASAECAQRNVTRNCLDERIRVVLTEDRVDSGGTLLMADGVLDGAQGARHLGGRRRQFDFCMCNPPFFETRTDREEGKDDATAPGVNVSSAPRRVSRPEPHSATVATDGEMFTEGGEVAFVARIIEDSVRLRERVRIYTSMVGKKSSVAPVKRLLAAANAVDVVDTAFCQGKTQRWAVAWTFDTTVRFTPDCKNRGKAPKRPANSFDFPRDVSEQYTPEWAITWLRGVFDELKITYERSGDDTTLECTATRNTWSNQRQKRRATDTAASCGVTAKQARNPSTAAAVATGSSPSVDASTEARLGLGDGTDSLSVQGDTCSVHVIAGASKRDVSVQVSLTEAELQTSRREVAPPTLAHAVFTARVLWTTESSGSCSGSRSDDGRLTASLQWTEGRNRDALNQIVQFCRNRLNVAKRRHV